MRQDSKFSAGVPETAKKQGAAHSPELTTPDMVAKQQTLGGIHSEHFASQEEQMVQKHQYHQHSIAEDGESNGHSMSQMGATVEMGASGNPLHSRMVQEFQRN